jgi:hypothetical protein
MASPKIQKLLILMEAKFPTKLSCGMGIYPTGSLVIPLGIVDNKIYKLSIRYLSRSKKYQVKLVYGAISICDKTLGYCHNRGRVFNNMKEIVSEITKLDQEISNRLAKDGNYLDRIRQRMLDALD